MFTPAPSPVPAPTPPQTVIKIVHTKEVGSTGSENYAGYPSEEYFDALQGTRRADAFDKMRRSDSQVKMCLAAAKNPILAGTWEIEKAPIPDLYAQEDADLIKWMLFDGMEKSWKEYLEEALSLLLYGHSVFEMIDKINMYHPQFGSVICLKTLAWRSPKTIERWNLDPVTGKLKSIEQYAYGDLNRQVTIDAQFLQVLTLEKEGSNYEGISALRSIYGNWFRKNNKLKLNEIGIEKHAIPTPVATIPANKEASPEFDKLVQVLENYTSHEKQYITIPEGWTIDLKTNVYDPEKVETSIDNEDKRMVKGFLANFLNLDSAGSGSYSLSFDLSDFFLGSLEHTASLITESFNRVIIPRMVKLNRGPRAAYPKLKVSGISDKAGEELARILDFMIKNKVITPDDILERHMRKRLGLPEMSLEGQRQITPPPMPGMPNPMGAPPVPMGPTAVPKLAEKIKAMRL
jgi:hypothetical protein